MGANNSNTKYRKNLYDTPPKANHRFLFDPRSPNDDISRTPIQIDSAPSVKLSNHVMPDIIEPEDNRENIQQEEEEEANEPKRSSGVEPTLDPTKVLATLVENNNGQLPPYQL